LNGTWKDVKLSSDATNAFTKELRDGIIYVFDRISGQWILPSDKKPEEDKAKGTRANSAI
jgi:glucose dehydrogenase